MKFITRGRSNPKGKPRVYISCHEEDVQYVSSMAEDILRLCDCAVFYSDEESLGTDLLSQMQLAIIPVTGRLLAGGNRCLDEELPLVLSLGIPVLPVLMEPDLLDAFSLVFGNRQFLNKTLQDATAIPYDKKLEDYLNSVLIGDELATKIRAAFDAYIFLSYRKMDRKYAQELMRLIHAIPDCRDVAIWYDEFLVPGENFDCAIRSALEKCHVFALAVTPNLLTPNNYVLDIEYPEAMAFGKPVLAAEMLPTDQQTLKESFRGIPDTVDARCKAELADCLSRQLRGVILAENDEQPEHLFFIGLAYLHGIDVEVDREKALDLISRAALAGLPEAAQKLASMYQNGEGVAQDGYRSVMWQEYYSHLLRPDYIVDVTGAGDELTGYLDYNFPCDVSKDFDWLSYGRWLNDQRTLIASDPDGLLAYIDSRWEWGDRMCDLGLDRASMWEKYATKNLAEKLFDCCPRVDTAVCFLRNCARTGYVGSGDSVKKAITLLENTPEAKHQRFKCYLIAGRSLALNFHFQKERDGYFRKAASVLKEMKETLSPSEAALLQADLLDAMGFVDSKGYSLSRNKNNPKNLKLLQDAYAIMKEQLEQRETPENLRMAVRICTHLAFTFENDCRKALQWHEEGAELCRRLYSLTRLPSDLSRHRQKLEDVIECLRSLRDQDNCHLREEELASLGGAFSPQDSVEEAERRLLRTYYDAACAMEDEKATHWLKMVIWLQSRFTAMHEDGCALRLCGMCWLRLGAWDRAASILRQCWLQYADEEAARLLPQCGCYDQELRAILYALRLEGNDPRRLLERAETAARFVDDDRLRALCVALQGGTPPLLEDPYGLEIQCIAVNCDSDAARSHIRHAMELLAAGHNLPLRAWGEVDVLTVVEHAAMGCTLARSLEDSDLHAAISIYESAVAQLRHLGESVKSDAVDMLLLRALGRLADAVTAIGMNIADRIWSEYRSLLNKLAGHSNDEKMLRKVVELAQKQPHPFNHELAAAVQLVQITGADEDSLALSRMTIPAQISGTKDQLLMERIILLQERLVRDGYDSVRSQLAWLLFDSLKGHTEHTPFWERRLRRIISLMQPLPSEFGAEGALALHAAAYLLGEPELCSQVERALIEGAKTEEEQRRAIRFAVDCLFDPSNHFADRAMGVALLENATVVAEQMLSDGGDRDVLQIAAIYQLCASYAEKTWQDKANEMFERISMVISAAPVERQLMLLDGLGHILWSGGQYDRAEECYLSLISLEEDGKTQVHLTSYAEHCEQIFLGCLELGWTERAKPWMDRCFAARLRLLEQDYSDDTKLEIWVSLSLAAEMFPEKHRKLFIQWYDGVIRQVQDLTQKHGENPANDLEDVARVLLSSRYFLRVARLNIMHGDWEEAGYNIYCVFRAAFEKTPLAKVLRKHHNNDKW